MLEKMGRLEEMGGGYGDGVTWLRGSLIGKGGFGSVYVGIKKPSSKFSCYPSIMAVKSAEISVSASIQRERQVLSDIKRCSDIITCYGDETTIGCNGLIVYNLLMEYASAGTLSDRIKKSGGFGLPESEVKVFARCMLRGLKHIHGLGYVHCDLKPGNVLLFPNERGKGVVKLRAKIGDFGLVKRATNQNKKRKLDNAHWQGTPKYLSPEAVACKLQDSTSDIWAFGCIVIEMLTGKQPRDEDRDNKGALPRIPSELSSEARSFLKGCIAMKPAYRFTAEMLLNHPFLDCSEDEDECNEQELPEIEVLGEAESILLVSGSEEDGSCEWDLGSEDDWEEAGNGEVISSSISIEKELLCEENKMRNHNSLQV